ncbi:MAG: pentapeptide repeat-containing protein [Myxococcota bacterium]|nr:pentapeptide repeat-containing protein [Myxococcota bacterium]
MARASGDPDPLVAIQAGKRAWREWRRSHDEKPDLRRAKLGFRDLSGLDLSGADLRGAHLQHANLRRARLVGARLDGCLARSAVMSEVKLRDAVLKGADLRAASLRRADLRGADLSGAVLRFTSLVGADVTGARFTGAEVYGLGAWNLVGTPADQSGLLIREKEGMVTTTVDDLDTAEFLHLLRDNTKIPDVIDTASRRTVLLLGRFTRGHKEALDAMRDHLLASNWVPVLFDFAKPRGRDLTETVASLAHMACFVIPDLSGAKSVPQELSSIVPHLPSVPVAPVIREGNERVYSMFEHFRRYPWVHEPVRYVDVDDLLAKLDAQVVRVGFREAMKARGLEGAPLPRSPPRRRRRSARGRGS